MARRSDRWVTPGVIVWGMLLGTLLLLAVIGSITFLTWRGLDPDPMIRLTANVAAAVGTVGTFVLQLVTRRTTTNVETKVGQLVPAVVDTLDELDAARAMGRHADPAPEPASDATAFLDPGTRPHPFPGRGTAPAVPRS